MRGFMQTILALLMLVISTLSFQSIDVVAKGHSHPPMQSSPRDNDVNQFTEGVVSWDYTKKIEVINHADPFFDAAIKQTLAAYEAAWPNMDFSYRDAGTDKGGSCNAVDGAIVFCDADSGWWYGSTTFGGQGHEITHARIALSSYFNDGQAGDEPLGYNTLNTVCHELGHAFGLKHILPALNPDGTIDESTLDTCMDPYEFGPNIPTSPTAQDIRHIQRLYEEWKQHYK